MRALSCLMSVTRGSILLFLVSGLLLSHPEAALAATVDASPLVHLTPAQTARFQTALTSLSNQAKVAIVTEGEPLNPSIQITIPDLTSGTSVSTAITSLAGAYDYNTQMVSGVFVLTKKYSDPKDMPCVTLRECHKAAQTIARMLDTFSPHFQESVYADGPDGQKDAIVKFFHSLSPSQLEAAQSKTLLYGGLSSGQQNIVNSLLFFPLIQRPADKVMTAGGYLDNADKSAVTLLDDRGYSSLFLALPGKSASATLTYLPLLGGVSPPGQRNPFLNLAPAAPISPKSLSSNLLTLSAVVKTLGPIDGQKPTVDPAVGNKPIMAFGLKYSNPGDVLHALVALYGLRDGVSDIGDPQIEPPYVPSPSRYSQVSASVWAALPISFSRALHIETGTPAETSATVATDGEPSASGDLPREEDDMLLPGKIQQEAGRCLLADIQPQVKIAGQNARVAVSSLDNDARRALAVLLMTNLVSALQNGFSGEVNQSVMACIDNMDQTIIYTVPAETADVNGEYVPSFYLVGTDPQTMEQVGLGSVRYISRD